MEKIITCTAPINIAVIKYWGKRNENLMLPLNDSISFTLSQDELCAKTTVLISPRFKSDRMWLNGREECISNPRIVNCLKEVRKHALQRWTDMNDALFDPKWCIHICSENNFPTAAGLASSAAGYACLVFALGQLFGLTSDLSAIARLGSGSACRSLLGGIVQWHMGELEDGSDSVATQVASEKLWSDVHVIICVANSERKKIGSTDAMRRSVNTSEMLRFRSQTSVHRRTQSMLEALRNHNWSSFCDLTMKDSNEMHAVCLDTFPPCVYMSDTSHAVCRLVHSYNEIKQELNLPEEKVCYTFDAGPNACLFLPSATSVNEFASLLSGCFPKVESVGRSSGNYWRGLAIDFVDISTPSNVTLQKLVSNCRSSGHSMNFFLHTKVGDGPRVLHDQDSNHLLNRITGLPLSGTDEST